MPFYSDEIVEEVRSRSDIVDVISQYVKLRRRGSNYVGLCPFHNEKTGSFSVSAAKQMYYCFGCGAGGDVFAFLMNYENETFTEALQELADRGGVTLPEREMTQEERTRADRRSRLLEVQNEISKRKNEEYVGRIERVLVDGVSKNDESTLSGRCDSSKIVNFKGDKSLIGKYIDVKITEAHTWSLNGETV